MIKKKTLTEILKNQTITNQFDFSGSCPDQEGTSQSFTIFTTSFFLNEINHNFFNRVMFVDPDAAFADLVSTFTIWSQNRGYMYARLAYAYSLGYNPIENYNSVEEHTGHDDFDNKKKVTHTWKQDKLERAYDAENPLKTTRLYDSENPLKVETGHTGDKEERYYSDDYKDTDASYKAGVNSSDYVKAAKTENTKDGKETLEYVGKRSDTTTGKYDDTTTGKYTDTHTGSYEDENSGKDSTIYDSQIAKHGNIGVSTASGMIQELFDGLKQNLALRAVHDFLDAFTFYDGEVSDIW